MNLKNIILGILALLVSISAFSSKIDSKLYPEKFLSQILDHSDPFSTTFRQRYYYIDSFAQNSKSPILVQLCGEWDCKVNEYDLTFALAKAIGAHLLILEHRYYGKSIPFENLTIENLSHLTFKNILADVANFQTELTKKLKFTGNWIYTGVSYAGTVAAYIKLKYPHFASGVVASSAPMKAKSELEEMDSHAFNTLAPSCRKAVIAANDHIKKIYFKKSALEIFRERLHSDYEITDFNLKGLAGWMAISIIPYGQQWIDNFCYSLEASPRAEQVVAIYNDFKSRYSIDLSDFGLEKIKKEGTAKQWMYQSCTTFGFSRLLTQIDLNQSFLNLQAMT